MMDILGKIDLFGRCRRWFCRHGGCCDLSVSFELPELSCLSRREYLRGFCEWKAGMRLPECQESWCLMEGEELEGDGVL